MNEELELGKYEFFPYEFEEEPKGTFLENLEEIVKNLEPSSRRRLERILKKLRKQTREL